MSRVWHRDCSFEQKYDKRTKVSNPLAYSMLGGSTKLKHVSRPAPDASQLAISGWEFG